MFATGRTSVPSDWPRCIESHRSICIALVLLILLYDAVSAHESEDALLVLVEVGGFGLGEEGAEMLRLRGQQLVGLGVEVDLQFFDFCEVDFVVVDIYFGHDFAVVVAELGINLPNRFGT